MPHEPGCGTPHLPLSSQDHHHLGLDDWEEADGFSLTARTNAQGEPEHYLAYCPDCLAQTGPIAPYRAERWIRVGRAHLAVTEEMARRGRGACRRCSVVDFYDIHHWAPRAVFGSQAGSYGTLDLCVPCHQRWHAEMVGYSRVKLGWEIRGGTPCYRCRCPWGKFELSTAPGLIDFEEWPIVQLCGPCWYGWNNSMHGYTGTDQDQLTSVPRRTWDDTGHPYPPNAEMADLVGRGTYQCVQRESKERPGMFGWYWEMTSLAHARIKSSRTMFWEEKQALLAAEAARLALVSEDDE